MRQVPDDESGGVVQLRHGSLMNREDLAEYYAELSAVFAERDRARRLAARLEEVCAMRTGALRALIEWFDAEAPVNGGVLALTSHIDWAKAQLEEIP